MKTVFLRRINTAQCMIGKSIYTLLDESFIPLFLHLIAYILFGCINTSPEQEITGYV